MIKTEEENLMEETPEKICLYVSLHISVDRDGKRPSKVSPVTDLSSWPIMHVTNVRESRVGVNLYGFIDSSLCFCLVHQSSDCSFTLTAGHKYFLWVCLRFYTSSFYVSVLFSLSRLLLLFLFWPGLIFPIASAFNPHPLRETVCSKDCNLTANLQGFLWARNSWHITTIYHGCRTSLESWELLYKLSFRKCFYTYSDAPAVTTRVVRRKTKRCSGLYLFSMMLIIHIYLWYVSYSKPIYSKNKKINKKTKICKWDLQLPLRFLSWLSNIHLS